MKKFIASAAICVFMAAAALAKPVVGQFIGYYNKEKPSRLPDVSCMTHLIFAPARINPDFTLAIQPEEHLACIPELRKINPDIKITLLVGGAKSQNFSQAAATPENRAKLLESFARVFEKYGFDGIDLDWEFPGRAAPEYGQTASPDDVKNYTLLMKEYRERFPEKILTVDVGNTVEHIDFEGAQKHADFFHLMSYDYSTIKHNAPLFRSMMTKKACVSESVEKLLKKVPAKKIVMGVPFYGHHIIDPRNPNPQMSFADAQKYIKKHNLTLCRDEVAKAPFYIDYKHNVRVICEDEKSIREKCRYAKSKGLAGVVAWQHFGDDSAQTLTRAMFGEMLKKPREEK